MVTHSNNTEKESTIPIEIAYALPDKQYLLSERVPVGTTVKEAIERSELLEEVPDLDYQKVGIFYKPVPLDTVLQAGDRIEIYRSLIADPKERRRKQVEKEREQRG